MPATVTRKLYRSKTGRLYYRKRSKTTGKYRKVYVKRLHCHKKSKSKRCGKVCIPKKKSCDKKTVRYVLAKKPKRKSSRTSRSMK